MEYVDGTEIKDPLPLDLALKAAIQLAGALEAAHRKSITRRDLKPANILSTKSGVKVLDFGLAKFEVLKPKANDETQTRALTQEGSIVGTPPIHGAGAVAGQGYGRALRYFFFWLRTVRDPYWEASFPRRQSSHAHRCHHRSRTGASHCHSSDA
jgi:serine/threonine protein kinase